MSSFPSPIPAAAPYPARDARSMPVWGRRSWGPIMMGVVCAIGLQFIFTVLGIALGTSTGEMATGMDGSSVRTVGIAAGLWWLVTGTLALGAGGFVFGRLSGLPRSLPLSLEAAAMWSVVALFGFMVVWSGAGMLSQAASPIGAMSASSLDPYGPRVNRTGASDERAMSLANGRSTDAPTVNSARAEDVRRATRAASWWAMIGLLTGLGASLGGAHGGAIMEPRFRAEMP
jgi:hypothetical protein